ncbi:MAG: nucleotide exchange factor GrpE [Candidatus Sumerlaeota bacterium]|nr:nucleotide exchange factor GrpE [Candidatus Sumerlaeota bacterium]
MASPIRTENEPSRARLAYRRRRRYYRGHPIDDRSRKEAAAAPALARLTHERDLLREALLRSRADFDNSRKRLDREREEISRRAGEELVVGILPVLDNFQRALQACRNASDAGALARGVEMILEQMKAVLAQRGLEPIEALGQTFDPHLHEAAGVETRKDKKENEIVEVLQDGFRYNGRLVRPAMVRVARRPAKE